MKAEPDNKMQLLADQILESRYHSPSITIRLCKRMIRAAAAAQNPSLLGFAYYYLGEAYYSAADYQALYSNLIKGLKYQEICRSYDLIARTYNILGLISSAQENVTVALENFCTGLEYCKNHQLYYIEGLIYTNIGELYKKLHAEKAAVKFLQTGIKFYKRSPGHPFCRTNLLISYAALGFCCLAQKEQAKALVCYTEIISLDRLIENDYHKPALYTFLFRYFHQTGDSSSRDALLPRLHEAAAACTSIYEFYESFFDSCRLLFELNYGDDLIALIHTLEKIISLEDSPALMLRLLTFKVQYYKSKPNKKHYECALMQYFDMKERQRQSFKDMTRSSINLRFVLEALKDDQRSMEEMNRLLQTKSEHDPLTGLANYMHLKSYLETQFENAREKKTALGVEILDIDYFKQYNDNYGHMSGDQALTAIADVLKSFESDRIFCGRYGGDEFIVIYTGMQDAEILSCADAIRSKIRSLHIPHCGNPASPCLSISQGIRNSVPRASNKSWDYLFAADTALYDAKESHKNSIHLIHRCITAERHLSQPNTKE